MSKQSIALLTCEIQGAATCWHRGTELQRKKRSNPRWGMLQWVFFFSTPKEKGRLPHTPLLLSFFLPHFLTPVLGESVFCVVVSFDSPFAFFSSFLSSCHKTKVNRKIVITVSSGAFFIWCNKFPAPHERIVDGMGRSVIKCKDLLHYHWGALSKDAYCICIILWQTQWCFWRVDLNK